MTVVRRRADEAPELAGWRRTLHTVIFESDTLAGKAFDVVLLILILASVMVIMLDSVESIRTRHQNLFNWLEWAFTLLFTAEYILRLVSVRRPWRYALSVWGLIDLLSIVPTYISFFLPETHYLLAVRVLRLLRIFRIFKLARHLDEAGVLKRALFASRRKITVFLSTVLTLVILFGTIMFVVEGPENGFSSIPVSIYWATVTLTTTGFGDIAPKTPLGQFITSLIMLAGYGIIAVPTGIYASELARESRREVSNQACPDCSAEGHDIDAVHCKYCGARL